MPSLEMLKKLLDEFSEKERMPAKKSMSSPSKSVSLKNAS